MNELMPEGLPWMAAVWAVVAGMIGGSALVVITRRNPVSAALFLVLSFFALAGIYVLMDAFFLAAVQVAVYAGAIMVLFLFVIMLLNLTPDELPRVMTGRVRWLFAIVTAALTVTLLALDMWCDRTYGVGAEVPIAGGADADSTPRQAVR